MGIYTDSVSQLAKEFIDRPIEYGTEADLRARLYQLLTTALETAGRERATVDDPRLVGETRTYKQPYKNTVERRFREHGTIRRVRLDASTDKRQQYDLVVFNETLEHPVEWIRSGSKRFDETDLDAAFGIKFIKNKCYPPMQCSITDDAIEEMALEDLQSLLQTKENNLLGDLEELRALPQSVDTYFLLASNNNYLFADPLAETERSERKKRRVGRATREWLADTAGDVDVFYVHPRGSTWLTDETEPTASI